MQKKISQMTYEEALLELENIVSQLESGSAALDDAIELYTRGSELKDHCQKKLNKAEEKISVVIEKNESSSVEIKNLPIDQLK